ncbi:hypothetical protein [Flavobacterium chryseum]|nr:hypothetical protein [Flavobacterium sp. P3160]
MENVFEYLKLQFIHQLDMVFMVENPSEKPVFKRTKSQDVINKIMATLI